VKHSDNGQTVYDLNDIRTVVLDAGMALTALLPECLTVTAVILQGGWRNGRYRNSWRRDPFAVQPFEAKPGFAHPSWRGDTPAWTTASAREIAIYARRLDRRAEWALITGAEPGEHDLAQLVRALKAEKFRVACETSCRERGHIGAGIDLIVTP
jgi:translation initiation factor 1 (eIF-1/SUI1)